MHYGTYQKELFAIYNSLQHFQNTLAGHTFTILTDHGLLENFMSQTQKNTVKNRWQTWMASCLFNFTIQYIEGKKNIIADALSRCGPEKYNTISKSSLENPNHNLPSNKPSIPIITNSNFLQPPTTPLHIKMPTRFHNIAGPLTAPHWQTVNYDYWNQDPVEEDSGIITTAAVTTRAQAQQEERLVKSKTKKPNKINQISRDFEENWGNFIDEDWTEEPMGE